MIARKESLTKHQPDLKREKMFSMISESMYDRVYESAVTDDYAYDTFEFPSGHVEVCMYRDGNVEVQVFHENNHESPMLENAIRKCLPDWDDVEEKAKDDLAEERDFYDYLWRNSMYW